MTEPKIEPHKITKPIQLLAVWLVALILIDGTFLTAAARIENPPWLPGILGIGAVVITLLFIFLIFLMQTKYRPQLQDDPYYAEYLRRHAKEFKNFHAENLFTLDSRYQLENEDETWEEREQKRISRYESNRGLFLVHTWRPSLTPGQIADIVIMLQQHREGHLTEGNVESVEYHLGPMFHHEILKTNKKDNFRLEVSAYGPLLCLAKVNFSDGTPPLELERYINF